MLRLFNEKDRYREFTKIRRTFEDFLLRHRILVNQVTVKYGSATKGYARCQQLLVFLVDQFLLGNDEKAIVTEMAKIPDFSFLQPAEKESRQAGTDFAPDAKPAIFLRDALKDPLRCGICGGLIHTNAISIDHVMRKADGGSGNPDNGQLSHPYCNTTIKN